MSGLILSDGGMTLIGGMVMGDGGSPPPVTEFVSDTFVVGTPQYFNGATSFEGVPVEPPYVGQLGANWIEGGWFSGTALSSLYLYGNSVGVAPGSAIKQDILASGTPPSSNYYVEVEFNLRNVAANAEQTSSLTLISRANYNYGNSTMTAFYAASLDYNGGSNAFIYIGSSTDPYIANVAITPPFGAHTMRYTITGSTHNVSIDGISVLTTSNASITAAGLTGFAIQDNNYELVDPFVPGITISSFTANE